MGYELNRFEKLDIINEVLSEGYDLDITDEEMVQLATDFLRDDE